MQLNGHIFQRSVLGSFVLMFIWFGVFGIFWWIFGGFLFLFFGGVNGEQDRVGLLVFCLFSQVCLVWFGWGSFLPVLQSISSLYLQVHYSKSFPFILHVVCEDSCVPLSLWWRFCSCNWFCPSRPCSGLQTLWPAELCPKMFNFCLFPGYNYLSAETNKIICEHLENSSALVSCEVKTVRVTSVASHRDFSWSEAHVLFHAEVLPPQGQLLTEHPARRGCLDSRGSCGYLWGFEEGKQKGVWGTGVCWGRAALPPCHVHRVEDVNWHFPVERLVLLLFDKF